MTVAKTLRKKGKVGKATQYMSRNQALKRLQISLVAFRKVCILRNVYPRSNDAVPRFHVKDIASLMQDPIIDTIRRLRVYKGKYKRFLMSLTRKDGGREKIISEFEQANKPELDLVSVVKERYPTFDHALEDLDEALNNVFLYAKLPAVKQVSVDLAEKCKQLSTYFLLYVLNSQSLTKVFISIKGFYFQAEIHGHKVTWLVPHTTSVAVNTKINFEVMNTYIDLYTTLLELVLFRLFKILSGAYPPTLNTANLNKKCLKKLNNNEELVFSLISTLNCPINLLNEQNVIEQTEEEEEFPDEEQEKIASKMRKIDKESRQFKNLFAGYKFFLSREVPQEIMTFVILSFGGKVSFEPTEDLGPIKRLVAPFDQDDETITHHIVDRLTLPNSTKSNNNRLYVQPQWVFDCVNKKSLIPTKGYLIGDTLPPHFSPFDQEKATIEDGYKEYLLKTQNRLADDMLEDDQVEQPIDKIENKQAVIDNKKLLVSSMPKKRRRLYEQIKKSRQGKSKLYKKKLIAN